LTNGRSDGAGFVEGDAVKIVATEPSGLKFALPYLTSRLVLRERYKVGRSAIMGFMTYAKDAFILMSIMSLLLVGLGLSLKSGVATMGRERGRQLRRNASGLIVAVVGCVAVLLMLQQMVGIPIGVRW
jgi:hypothetical protein